MKEILLYEHPSKFKLIDFQMSHSELLLRSYAYSDQAHNIDILFKGTHSLNMTTTLKGLKIYAVPISPKHISGVLENGEEFIFKLLSDQTAHYINASAFGVFHNQLGFGCSSLGDFMWSDENECVFWSHEHPEFKAHYHLR